MMHHTSSHTARVLFTHTPLMQRTLIRHFTCATRTHSAAVSSSSSSSSSAEAISRARDLLQSRNRILAITGAGISTESGIPDYRSPGRPPHRPTSHQQFMASHATRQRYWARSMQGFDTLLSALPNSGHYALSYAELHHKRISGIITQNVDLLHTHAGSRNVLHLHGTIEKVRCMTCGHLEDRATFQNRVRELNPSFLTLTQPLSKSRKDQEHDHLISPGSQSMKVVAVPREDGDSDLVREKDGKTSIIPIPTAQRPDGDSDLAITDYSQFIIPSCRECTDGFGKPLAKEHQHAEPHQTGILKPSLVFFGANVSSGTHERADAMLAASDAIIVAGTSLTVWSAFRLIRAALNQAVPGYDSVVSVAEQMNKLLQQSSSYSGGTTIADGTAILAPVTQIEMPLQSSSSSITLPRRVPSSIPIVILNHGPTRADQFLQACESGIIKLEARTGDALHSLLDVPRAETKRMEQELLARRKMQHAKDHNIVQETMKQHANIE